MQLPLPRSTSRETSCKMVSDDDAVVTCLDTDTALITEVDMIRFLSVLLFVFFSLKAYSNTLLIVGDSLSAGYQMSAEQSWPVLMGGPVLVQQGHSITVVNASISGDTTGNGLARLPKLLQQHNPDYVIIELGANDGLRGFSPSTIRKNLSQMITPDP